MTIWKSNLKGDDKIIAYFNNTIYKGNPKPEEIDSTIRELNSGNKPKTNLFGIPQSLLKEIHLEEGKEYIQVFFGDDSYELLRINDENKRLEIFDFFKQNIPKSTTYTEEYSKLKAGKKPLYAMVVIAILFSWSFYLATQIETGSQYEIIGDKRSITSIILILASLGTTNLILLFGILFIIAILGFIQKTKRQKTVHKIVVIR